MRRVALVPTAVLLLFSLLVLAPAQGTPRPPGGIDADIPDAMLEGLRYHYVGPSRGGRVTTVAGHAARPETFYMGATGGGVWRTENYGHSWHPIGDGFFATGSIGAIAVAPSDPDIVYVATGSDGLRSNVIIGKGVYKSTDGGDTWEHVGLEATGNAGAVLIHPENPDRVFVAAIGNPFIRNPERGVYRSDDGGASWEKVLFVSDGTGAVDLEFAPDNPDEIYAAMWQAERKPWTILSGGMEGGLFKSSDGGTTWARLGNGLPGGLRGKADLAVSAGDPDRVYALIEAPGQEGGVYRSDDRGATWRQVSDFQPIRNRPFYYTNLHAHPVDPDVIWGMAEGYYRSDDGGESWNRQSTPHGDNHDLWINPDNPSIMIQSNDGGANVSLDGGRSWSTQNNQPTAELYQVDVDDAFPYRLYAGQQDNSTISVPSRELASLPGGHTASWREHGGCETGPIVPRPGDPDIVYANCKGRFGLYDARTGQEKQNYVGYWNLYGRNPAELEYRFQRVVPVHVSPHDPDRVYHGSQYVHVTEDGGQTWTRISPDLTAFTPETQVVSGAPITIDATGEEHFSVLYDIQESPHEPGVIWAGSNDGPIHVTRDGGASWTDVTPEGLPPHGRVQNIEVSPHDPATAYATVLRYQLGDFRPYAYRTRDYGSNWELLTSGTNGIPADTPVRVVREDPDREGLLYAGTEFGMYVSFDAGAAWKSLQLNLPVTPVTDIKVHRQDLVLSTMGRGFWILYDLTPLHEMSAEVASWPAHMFAVKPAYRLSGGFRFGEPAPDEPEYPAPGASIDYWLGAAPSGAITLEIYDAAGSLVRGFSSAAEGQRVVDAQPGMREWELERVGTPRLPDGPGLHRFVWDLRAAGPWDSSPRASGRRGPLVVPGRYRAVMTVDGGTHERTIEVLMNPLVAAAGVSPEDLRAQLELATTVRDTLSAARALAQRVEQEMSTATGERLDVLSSVQEQLVTAPVRYSPPVLLDQLEYLYGNITRAEQRPNADAVARHEALAAQLEGLRHRFDGESS